MVESSYSSDVDILTLDVEERVPEDYEESLPIGEYVIDLGEDGELPTTLISETEIEEGASTKYEFTDSSS